MIKFQGRENYGGDKITEAKNYRGDKNGEAIIMARNSVKIAKRFLFP